MSPVANCDRTRRRRTNARPNASRVEPSGDNTASRPQACCEAPPGIAQPPPANENGGCALTVMPRKTPQSDSTGPMRMQPIEREPTTPTQMLPIMPGTEAARETKTPAPEKKPRTRTDAVRAAMAKITRRNSLRKQRDAQKS